MITKHVAVVILGAGLAASTWSTHSAQSPATAAPGPNDYADGKSWLCRPDRQDACAVDLATTIVAADGTLTREPWTADPNAPIDCFYVYPTVSTDTAPHSDMSADPAELNVVRSQFARFASKCRPYAPLYRQVTLAALRRARSAGERAPTSDRGLGYDDVRDAWHHYLQHDNKGRGFVLIGHSQGAIALTELIRREIDGKPDQARLVSALLLGTTIAVPRGADVGGAFKHIPVCRSAAQTGCAITFASFRSTVPPSVNTLFGKVAGPGMTAACTNPAALDGTGGDLHAYLSSTGRTLVGTTPPRPWVVPERTIETPFVSVPGLLTARCVTSEHATYLEVTVKGNPADPRVDDIGGDVVAGGPTSAVWGLHLLDVHLAMGNLLDIVGRQARAYGPTPVRPATEQFERVIPGVAVATGPAPIAPSTSSRLHSRPMKDKPWATGLRRVLSERGWTQGQLADKAGIRPSTVSALFRSDRGCQISTLEQLAKALRVPVWEFFVTLKSSQSYCDSESMQSDGLLLLRTTHAAWSDGSLSA